MIWIFLAATALLTAFVSQAILLREPFTHLRKNQPTLFESIGGDHALNQGWYTWRFTLFLLKGNFDGVIENDHIISRFTTVMWISRMCYLTILICVLASAF